MTRLNIATEAYVDAETTRAGVAETALVLTTVDFSWSGGPQGTRVTGLGTFAGPGLLLMAMVGTLGLVKAAPVGEVLGGMTLILSNIPVNNSDVLDIGCTITVSNLAMTEVLELQGGHSNTVGLTSYSTGLNEGTLSPTITGSDLAIASGIVTSTAGGVFMVTYSFSVGWD